jgi:DNA-binding response OmpR family regulator
MGRMGQAGTREACPVRDGEHAVIGQQEASEAGVLARPVTAPRVLVVDGFEQVIRAGEITLYVDRMEADMGHGPLSLTRLEFLVLKELMEHAGQAVSKGQLLESVWGYDFDPGSNIVGVCVRRLRAKIGEHLIKTVRGEGYSLAVS